MTVSVIMTCHNEERYVEQAVRSVIAQTAYDRVREIIVVNDGSQDGSQLVLERLARECDKLKIIEAPGRGVSSARNLALHFITGEFIAILDGDDYWSPQKLAQQLLAFLNGSRIGLVYGDFIDFSCDDASDARTVTVRRFHPDGRHHLRDYYVHDGPIIPSASIIRRDAFKDVGIFDENLRVGEDTEFCLRLAEKWRFCYAPGAFTFKRRHAGQFTHRLDTLLPNAALLTQRFAERHPELAPLSGRRMARHHAKVSADYAMIGEERQAMNHALVSLRLSPGFWRGWAQLALLIAPTPVMRTVYQGAKGLYHLMRR